MLATQPTKTAKKIIKFLLAGILGLGTLFVPLKDTVHHTMSTPVVYAATGDTTTITDSQKAFADTLETILKIIYLLLWPFLALAGLALDNGMVYGSYFQLDSALFTFWNIVKNFANFALGFLFLRSILKYIFNFGSKAENPMNMITKLLIAGIGIQASRFVMGALIDLSTVATVGVGGLPLQLLSQDTVGKKPLFGIKTNLKISDVGDALTTDKGFVILYTYPTKKDEYYLPCAVVNQELLKDDDRAATFGVTATGKKLGGTDATRDQINKNYCIFGSDVLSFDVVGSKKILPGSDELKTMLTDSQTKFRSDNSCDSPTSVCQTISNIAQKGKGYQGAFYSLYGSLLNLGSIHVSVHKSTGSMTMEALIKAIIGISYLVPLLILCVVLIIRIAVLRITIAFSPVLVLAEVFGFKLGDMEKFGIKNALSMIFLPVMVTFAISISIVFLAVLSEGLTKGNSLKDIGMGTSSEGDKTCLNLVITTLCIDTPSQDIGVSGMLDFFPWIILNIFGIGLMWTILMATLKSTKFTEGVVNSLDKFAKNMVATANIVPLPGGATSVAALKNTARNISGRIDQAAAENANTVVSPAIENWTQKNFSGQVGKGQEQLNAATQKITSTNNARTEVSRLLSNQGALHNEVNNGGFGTSFNNRNNNLDLSQYGAAGLGLINKIAATAPASFKVKQYSSVDEAFKDENFLKYLADPKAGLGMNATDIRALYSGRDGKGNATHEEIYEKIEQVVTSVTAVATQGTQSGKTYTTGTGTVYTLMKDGFTEKKKGDKNESHLTTKKDRDNIVDNGTIGIATIQKMVIESKETLDKPFDDRLKAKSPTTTTTQPQTPPNTTPSPTQTPTPGQNPQNPSTTTSTTTSTQNTGTPPPNPSTP